MKKKMYLCGLKFLANFALLLASTSITQCSMIIMYQMPVDAELKNQIMNCKKKNGTF